MGESAGDQDDYSLLRSRVSLPFPARQSRLTRSLFLPFALKSPHQHLVWVGALTFYKTRPICVSWVLGETIACMSALCSARCPVPGNSSDVGCLRLVYIRSIPSETALMPLSSCSLIGSCLTDLTASLCVFDLIPSFYRLFTSTSPLKHH